MRVLLLFAICACLVAAGCATTPPPENYQLTWAKRGVSYETFVADVEACNALAATAADNTPQRQHDAPPSDVLSYFLTMGWRWVEHGFDQERAMVRAYDVCFRPRGYRLIYVTQEDASRIFDLGWGEAQMHALHDLAIAPHPQSARVPLDQQRAPMLVGARAVWPPR